MMSEGLKKLLEKIEKIDRLPREKGYFDDEWGHSLLCVLSERDSLPIKDLTKTEGLKFRAVYNRAEILTYYTNFGLIKVEEDSLKLTNLGKEYTDFLFSQRARRLQRTTI